MSEIIYERSYLERTLRNGFTLVNGKVRDWNYWCGLEEFRPWAWRNAVEENLNKFAKRPQYGSLWALTNLAVEQFELAKKTYVEPDEFEAILAEIEATLREGDE
jgi:hypothetical protein